MYIWIAIDVDDKIIHLKEKTCEIEKLIGFKNSNFTLPFHISLKMSFFVENSIKDSVISTIEDCFSTVKAFTLKPGFVEKDETIVWLRYNKSEMLNKIHDDLNFQLAEKHCIGLHPYDLDYKFHTTLFMDNDKEKISRAYELVKDTNFPGEFTADKLIIGGSESGRLGTFSVFGTYAAK